MGFRHVVTGSRIRRRVGLVAIVIVGLGSGTIIQAFSWNQTAHYALIRALDNGTAQIDAYAVTTGDRARYHGHWYSARAPGLAIASLPAYASLRALGVDRLTRANIGNRFNDEMMWILTLWAALLPAVGTMLLVRYVADRIAPGYGTITAVTLGAGTLLLPFSTLLFAHVLSTFLGFAAFTFLWAERELRPGRERLWTVAVAGVLAGFALSTEYPLLFVGIVVGAYAISRGDRVKRGIAYACGAMAGVVPLLIYNVLAFGSPTHVAYADIPEQQRGFFGIELPRPSVAVELLFSSRGLLTLSPVLVLGIVGTVLMYRRGRRVEALVIAAIALVFLAYNAGYFLPFGGGAPGPRFLIPTLPFLALGLAPAYRRYPVVTLGFAAVSVVCMAIPTMVWPLVSAEGYTGTWSTLLSQQNFEATIFTAAGLSGWASVVPFLGCLAVAGGLAWAVTPRRGLSFASLATAGAWLGAWALLAVLAPSALGIDRASERVAFNGGDRLAMFGGDGPHPISGLVLIALAFGLLTLLAALAASHAARWRRTRVSAIPAGGA